MRFLCAAYTSQLKKAIDVAQRLVWAQKLRKEVVQRMVALHKILKRRLLFEIAIPINALTYPIEVIMRGPPATIEGWNETEIPEDLRVDSKDQLRRIYEGFKFPGRFVSAGRNVFTGEEYFLFGLYRLSNTGKYHRKDVQSHFGFF